MAMNLFSHNEAAYNAVISMLQETGRAAVIHPTGTGKSFIGFKLCEEHPAKTICWLSPSEYIFKTQLENLKAATQYEPNNIQFLTYSKLMFMDEEEIAEIKSDYIVLDEFHRCGAEMWGQSVGTLLKMHPTTPVLGLSATNIRYLDNRRDMAVELFNGNVASEMSLGEAIVRGILNPPKYVLSMFQYGEILKKYEKQVKRAKNKMVRDAAEKYLEELRRAIEKADGLDVIFDKHMTKRTGKYIVFCANKEHMDKMMERTDWFAKVDKEPRLYSLYTPDPEASKSFEEFKADQDDSHLRLLFCIDALNEGIHVDDISGVILLRPTVSPIIYKQQIGRALSASQKKDAVIFDIVLNVENLYTIGAIEEEMEMATSYYHFLGDKEAVVNEHFTIIDEVRDCRLLFERLSETLSASWEMYYEQAKAYYEANGNLAIPARYVTDGGYALGRWIYNQKGIRGGTITGVLTEEQIEKLDHIGMIWGNYSALSFERNYAAARAYYEEHGELNPPARYVTKEGVALGNWLSTIRAWKSSGVRQNYLTPERVEKLNRIGMIWSALDYFWERNYLAAEKYYHENGNLDVPTNYVSTDGIKLGAWIRRMRSLRAGKGKGTPPSEEQIARLDQIGMIWTARVSSKWEVGFAAAKEYVKVHGNLLVPVGYTTDSGYQLRNWIDRQRMVYRKGTISAERKQRLDSIGMVWEVDSWENRFALVKKYYEETGTIQIPQNKVMEGVWIGKWIVMQKKAKEAGKLSQEQVERLEELESLKQQIQELQKRVEEIEGKKQPHTPVPIDGEIYSFDDVM